jgi:hypothetical protein
MVSEKCQEEKAYDKSQRNNNNNNINNALHYCADMYFTSPIGSSKKSDV